MDIVFREMCARLDDDSTREVACRRIFELIDSQLIEKYILDTKIVDAFTTKVIQLYSAEHFKEFFFSDTTGIEFLLKINDLLDCFVFMSSDQQREFYWYINRSPKFIPFRVDITFEEFFRSIYSEE